MYEYSRSLVANVCGCVIGWEIPCLIIFSALGWNAYALCNGVLQDDVAVIERLQNLYKKC